MGAAKSTTLEMTQYHQVHLNVKVPVLSEKFTLMSGKSLHMTKTKRNLELLKQLENTPKSKCMNTCVGNHSVTVE